AARVSSGRIQVTGGPAGAAGAARAKPAAATIALVAGVTAAVTAAITIFLHGMMHQPVTWAATRFSISAPPGTKLDEDASQAALSPDGRMVAFTATDSGGTSQIYVRPLDTLAARAVPGTDNAHALFWSPDSRFLAFFADGKLKKAPLGGGEVEPLANASNGRGGTWNRGNVIVYAPEGGGPLYRVSANGGDPQQLTTLDWIDRSGRQIGALNVPAANYQWTTLSPDGRSAAMARQDSPGQSNIWMVDLQSAVPTRFTFGNTLDNAPLFWPDGSRLIYQ